MNISWVKDYWPVIVAAVGLVGFAYLMDYRLAAVEKTLTTYDVKDISREVKELKCETKNVKRVLRQQPEVDCD